MPALAAEFFTTCQITFSVMPLPQTVPFLVTQRKTRPPVIEAAANQLSIAALTQSGNGDGPDVGGFAHQIHNGPMVFPLLQVIEL